MEPLVPVRPAGIWRERDGDHRMKTWMKPRIEEICIGLEINDYFPAEL
jgi:coenzyme PQQ precursor peptide PqqA